MNPTTIIILLAAAFLTVLAVLVVVFLKRKIATGKRLDDIHGSSTDSVAKKPKESRVSLESFNKSKLSSNEKIKRFTTIVQNELISAGLGDDPIRVLLVWIIIVIILPLVENLLGFSFSIILSTILVAALGPVLYIQRVKHKRKEKFEKQLPHAIDIICNALKSGYTFQYAMNNVAKELDDPISEEFLMAFRETQYGVSLSDALMAMSQRTSSADIELLNIAVSVQTNVGGNMIEILESISSTLTAKHDLEEDIKVKTASGKITGILLAVLPIVLLIAMNFINPDYISIFLEEELGHYMLIFCAIWELIGFIIIRKILKVRY